MSYKSRPLVKEFLCSGIHKSTNFSNELGVSFPRNSIEEKILSLLSSETLKALNWEIKGMLVSGAPAITQYVIWINLGNG